jgi:hypothetical protein
MCVWNYGHVVTGMAHLRSSTITVVDHTTCRLCPCLTRQSHLLSLASQTKNTRRLLTHATEMSTTKLNDHGRRRRQGMCPRKQET